jgi:hypothetical protein
MNRDTQTPEINDEVHNNWNKISRRYVEDTIRKLRPNSATP